MSKWLVPIVAYGQVYVEAETFEEALDKADEETGFVTTMDFDNIEIDSNCLIENLDTGMCYSYGR